MRIGEGPRAQILRAVALAGPLRVADEEALLGREAVAALGSGAGRLGFPGEPREHEAAQVGDVLAFGQLAVDLDVVDDGVPRVLVDDALRAVVELPRVLLRPPVLEIALRVELASMVVEPVRQLVADGAAGVAVVGRVVHLRIVQGRLQHACGEVDVVHLQVVRGIDRRRRHAPLAAVERLADLREPAPRLEQVGARHVAGEVIAPDVHGSVVAPFVRVSDLVHDGVQLFQGLLLGRRAHPLDPVEVVLHRLFDLLRHVQGLLFQLGAEGAAHELLAERFAQLRVDQRYAALPARLQLRHSVKGLAEEIKVFVHECGRQERRARVGGVPAQIGLDVGEGD